MMVGLVEVWRSAMLGLLLGMGPHLGDEAQQLQSPCGLHGARLDDQWEVLKFLQTPALCTSDYLVHMP